MLPVDHRSRFKFTNEHRHIPNILVISVHQFYVANNFVSVNALVSHVTLFGVSPLILLRPCETNRNIVTVLLIYINKLNQPTALVHEQRTIPIYFGCYVEPVQGATIYSKVHMKHQHTVLLYHYNVTLKLSTLYIDVSGQTTSPVFKSKS